MQANGAAVLVRGFVNLVCEFFYANSVTEQRPTTSVMQGKHLHIFLTASDVNVVSIHCSESDNSTADQLWLELGHCQTTFTRSVRGAFRASCSVLLLYARSHLIRPVVCTACFCPVSPTQYWDCLLEQRRSEESLSEDPEGAPALELDNATCCSPMKQAHWAKAVTG